MRLFFDTSALVKRYVEEEFSERVFSLFQDADEIGISIICISEIISTLSRLKREKNITLFQYRKIKNQFENDLQDFYVCDINPHVIELSVSLLEKYKLRAADSIHLSNAILWKCDFFVSFDKDQLSAAKKTGLKLL